MSMTAIRRPVLPIALLSLAALVNPCSVLAQNGHAQPAATATSASSANALDPVDVANYRRHVLTLANPFFEGRGSGSRGNALAADYLEWHYRNAGLTPLFAKTVRMQDGNEVETPNATYRQTFSVGNTAIVHGEALSFGPAGAPPATELKPGTDFNVLAVSGSGRFEGPAAFAGYSIEDGQDEYNSYAETDKLDGHAVIVLRFEPMNAEGKSRWTNGRWSNAAALMPKIRNAAERGAAAVIVVSPPGADDPRVDKLETVESSRGYGRPLDIPVLMMTAEQADALVRAGDEQGRSLADLRKAADEKGGVTMLPKVSLRIGADVEQKPKNTDNLAGILPGVGPLAQDYIVIGAHYDHVGFGLDGGSRTNENGKIHPGADDNASGSSGVLIAIDQLKKMYEGLPADQPRRSILFMHYSGEELGLLGSRHFIRDAPIESSRIYAMLNMDMIGRLRDDPGLEVGGTGTAEGFDDLVDPILESAGLNYHKSPGGQGPSDHATFYGANIPVLFLFTGFHDEYHAPGDVADLINCEGAVSVVDLLTRITGMLATRPEPLTFKTTTPTFNRGGPAAADTAQVPSRQTPSIGQMKIRFGIAPGDYADGEAGVQVGEVFPNTSAADAGILAGDRLLKWNDKEILDVASWMGLMAPHNAGDVVDVTVKRKGEEKVIKVTLKAREQGAR